MARFATIVLGSARLTRASLAWCAANSPLRPRARGTFRFGWPQDGAKCVGIFKEGCKSKDGFALAIINGKEYVATCKVASEDLPATPMKSGAKAKGKGKAKPSGKQGAKSMKAAMKAAKSKAKAKPKEGGKKPKPKKAAKSKAVACRVYRGQCDLCLWPFALWAAPFRLSPPCPNVHAGESYVIFKMSLRASPPSLA